MIYKIYFNKSVFLLSDDAKLCSQFALKHKFVDKEKMHRYVAKKMREKEPFSAFLYHSDCDELLNAFECYFQVREAAGGLVEKEGKKRFLAIHKRGIWDLPKGHVDKGETLRECAVREVSEECSLKEMDLEVVVKLGETRHIYKLKNQWCIKHTHWYLMNFIGIGSPKPQKKEGIKSVTWFQYKNRDYFLHNAHPSIWDVVLKRVCKEF